MAKIVSVFAAALRQSGAVGERPQDRAVTEAVEAMDIEAMRRALAAGGAANAVILTSNGHSAATPLNLAAYRGDVEMCRVLLDAGADPNDGGRDGPPLIGAARCGQLEAVLLLNRGADPNKPNPSNPARPDKRSSFWAAI